MRRSEHRPARRLQIARRARLTLRAARDRGLSHRRAYSQLARLAPTSMPSPKFRYTEPGRPWRAADTTRLRTSFGISLANLKEMLARLTRRPQRLKALSDAKPALAKSQSSPRFEK